MANFEKLAKKSTRANMFEQMKDLDVEPETKKEDKADKDGPGSEAYIKRRDKQAQEDLKNAPRRK